ncbi:FG-GAP repeat protein [Candidatus Jidaibacter acanthamoeba]|uniref:FG-GAP repeat protein n=1 Tax=Candidatus Jidaibacter acanthamoebae TaxID=86105 RepID=A0A0C1QI27_9RICK|nr:integrin alpha [Candidatus Jidaibacter acanthamoeba]KIE05154.1 FG-GAP repeat protein [Candidatus Jidaibacter acanthamoeba]
MSLPNYFNLKSLNGKNGFTIEGMAYNNPIGKSVNGAGDMNGDEFDDLIIGNYEANSRGGASYIIYGSKEGFPANFQPSILNGTNGFTINRITDKNGFFGYSVSSAGDINGDGYDDVIIGAHSWWRTPGEHVSKSYVVFGSKSALSADFNGKNGFVIQGNVQALGYSVSSAGDINGDGYDDLIIGAPYTNSNAGAAYVILGSKEPFPAIFEVSTLNGVNGFIINGVKGKDICLGLTVAKAGDINGDGYSDVIMGTGFNAGAAYVVFGNKSPFPVSLHSSDLDGNNGFAIVGAKKQGTIGNSVSSLGDFNGDGIDDLVTNELFSNGNDYRIGNIYVLFGSRSPFSPSFDIADVNGNNGFAIKSEVYGDPRCIGNQVSGLGDINGDGLGDLIIGNTLMSNFGSVNILYGSGKAFPASIGCNYFNGVRGITIEGIRKSGYLGGSVGYAGDVDGNGVNDIIIGAPNYEMNYDYSGSVFVVLSDNANRLPSSGFPLASPSEIPSSVIASPTPLFQNTEILPSNSPDLGYGSSSTLEPNYILSYVMQGWGILNDVI